MLSLVAGQMARRPPQLVDDSSLGNSYLVEGVPGWVDVDSIAADSHVFQPRLIRIRSDGDLVDNSQLPHGEKHWQYRREPTSGGPSLQLLSSDSFVPQPLTSSSFSHVARHVSVEPFAMGRGQDFAGTVGQE